jgi:hypothetical protein
MALVMIKDYLFPPPPEVSRTLDIDLDMISYKRGFVGKSLIQFEQITIEFEDDKISFHSTKQ